MTNNVRRRPLRGRWNECEALDRLLGSVRAGHSQVLVIRGEAGIGKTALLELLLEGTSGRQVARAMGVESEMELAFAGLHQLCAPFLDRLERLPGPQRDSLRMAFGLNIWQPPGGFLVDVGVLGLLSEVAEERPLVCVIDDLQPQDRASAQAFAFIARRLLAEGTMPRPGDVVVEPIALVFAAGEPSEAQVVGLAELLVRGLSRGDARALLDSLIPARLGERVRDARGVRRGGAREPVPARAEPSPPSCPTNDLTENTMDLLAERHAEPIGHLIVCVPGRAQGTAFAHDEPDEAGATLKDATGGPA